MLEIGFMLKIIARGIWSSVIYGKSESVYNFGGDMEISNLEMVTEFSRL